MAKARRRSDLANDVCEVIRELTAERSFRSYAGQWVMVHDIAERLGIGDEEALEAIRAAGSRLVRDADPPHSVSLVGWGED